MVTNSLVIRSGLDAGELAAVRELMKVCNHADGIALKFNWDMMESRDPNRASDFCWYDNGTIVGYMPLDGFDLAFEITAAVLPRYRRRGIFTRLYNAAVAAAREQRASTALLVNYRASATGNAVVKALGLPYDTSEYHLEVDAGEVPPLPANDAVLEEVTAANVDKLAQSMSLSFGGGRWNTAEQLLKSIKPPHLRSFLLRRGPDVLGQVSVIADPESVYIRALGIVPQWRSKGYGRYMLVATIHRMVEEGYHHFELDVATDNANALHLYTSSGFRETNVYDYYRVPLNA